MEISLSLDTYFAGLEISYNKSYDGYKEIIDGFSLEDVCYGDDEMNKQETEEVENVKEIFKAMGYT